MLILWEQDKEDSPLRPLSPSPPFVSILLSAGLYENNTALLKCINDTIDDPEENKIERTIQKHLLCEYNHYTLRAGPNYKRVRVLNYGMCTFVIANG